MTFEAFKTSEMEGWDARAKQYDDITGQITTRAIPTLLAMAETAPGMCLLDLCCGTGRVAGAAAALGAEAEGIDVSPRMVDLARSAFPGATFAVGDAEVIPRPDAQYDAVVCSFGLMHVGDTDALFRESARVLNPGGRLALSHWVGPPESPFFRNVFGTIKRLADMGAVPPSPPPFALSSEAALRNALRTVGFEEISVAELPLVFRAPEGRFAEHFRAFAARASVILDQQTDTVLSEIYAAWDEQLGEFVDQGEYRIPMPALAVSGVRTSN